MIVCFVSAALKQMRRLFLSSPTLSLRNVIKPVYNLIIINKVSNATGFAASSADTSTVIRPLLSGVRLRIFTTLLYFITYLLPYYLPLEYSVFYCTASRNLSSPVNSRSYNIIASDITRILVRFVIITIRQLEKFIKNSRRPIGARSARRFDSFTIQLSSALINTRPPPGGRTRSSIKFHNLYYYNIITNSLILYYTTIR